MTTTTSSQPRYFVDYSHAYMGYIVRDSYNGNKIVPDTNHNEWEGAQVMANAMNKGNKINEFVSDGTIIGLTRVNEVTPHINLLNLRAKYVDDYVGAFAD